MKLESDHKLTIVKAFVKLLRNERDWAALFEVLKPLEEGAEPPGWAFEKPLLCCCTLSHTEMQGPRSKYATNAFLASGDFGFNAEGSFKGASLYKGLQAAQS